MKLIIDIPEEEYNECKNRFNMIYQEGYLNYNLNTSLVMYIANGTPLPKEHGRLIDADALFDEVSSWGMNDYEPSDFTDEIDRTKTIIEADKRRINAK